ncbi:MAG: rhomboid family intramembrane serine protease [Cellulomonas iranensis]|uniref:rhomboid family intramembrane serine protease n=1 Tax=Cellulomonas iranensis TaxID=76862 RepID=UPI001B161634|nr:rhomboid family intramembrane serine protease [Cellulomonas iranensis]MBO9568041.1 rhomboid family intramembrane serine protease [Cellulomonas iranensis]UCN16615.1 rhomboid family intramembrane serine protease [Cellulomonas iranensis]
MPGPPAVPGDGGAGAPVCPRHPDRVSYVRCQRCGRPACPECQRPAAVGVHCVDCVAEAARTSREGRTVFGGRVRGGRPVVTLTFIGLCVVSYLLQLTVPGWTMRWVFSPSIGEVEPWRFLTAAFLHSQGQVFHILFNMIALWMVGPYLEQALGRARFATLYLLSAVGGSVGAVVLAPVVGGWNVGLVGASGAVFGLFGAVLVVMRRLGRDAGPIIGILVLNGVLGFVLPGIAWQAHLGGLVVGAALGAAFAYVPRERRALVGWVAPAVVAAVLLGATLAVYSAYPIWARL